MISATPNGRTRGWSASVVAIWKTPHDLRYACASSMLACRISGLRVSAAVSTSVLCVMLSVFCDTVSVAGWWPHDARATAVMRLRKIFFIFKKLKGIGVKRNL